MNGSKIDASSLSRARVYGLLIGIAAINAVVYAFQIEESNAYLGYLQPLHFSFGYLVTVALSIAVLGQCLPVQSRRPSEVFCLVYGLLVPLSYITLHPVAADLSPVEYTLRLLILMLPLWSVYLVAGVVPGLKVPQVLTSRNVEILIVVICTLGTVAAVVYGPQSAGFDIDTSYERRLEGRETFGARSPLAYATAMITNGLLPFLAFVAGIHRKNWLFALAVVLAVTAFYVLGSKAQFVYIALALLVGRGMRRPARMFFYRLLFGGILAVFCIFLIEKIFLDVTFSGEYIFRRGFVVPAHVVESYFDFTLDNRHQLWSWTRGAAFDEGLSFLLGDLYTGLPTANMNTNAFVFALASGGVPGYLGAMLIVGIVFGYLDAAYKGSGNRALVYLGFSYAILLVEQAATTALMTSGMGALILLVTLAMSGWRAPQAVAGSRTR